MPELPASIVVSRRVDRLGTEEPIPIHDESDVISGRHLPIPLMNRESKRHCPSIEGDDFCRCGNGSADERRREMIDGDSGSHRRGTFIERPGKGGYRCLFHQSHDARRSQDRHVSAPESDGGVVFAYDKADGCTGTDFDLHMRKTVPNPRVTESMRGRCIG